MGTGSFPGVKYGRGVLLTTHPLLVPRSWKSRAIPLRTLWATTGPVTGTVYLYLYYYNLPTTNSYFRIFNFYFFAFRAPISSLALQLEHIINYLLKITIGGAIYCFPVC